jgi:hypothetical protein
MECFLWRFFPPLTGGMTFLATQKESMPVRQARKPLHL